MRFLPDTWLDALLRPLAMAAPDANVYIEIMAPDFRFLMVLGVLVLLGALALRRRRGPAHGHADAASARPVFVLLAGLVLAFIPWLATTGNGRYFMPGLLLVGPVCIGLARLLPLTRAMRLTLAAGFVAVQAFAVQQSAPWQAWTLVPWKDAPYFQVDVPPQWRTQPATIVTMSAITYSVLAPQFDPRSRWMGLHAAPPPASGTTDARRTEAFLAKAQPGRLLLLVPVVAGMLTEQRLPDEAVSAAIASQLAPYRLDFARPQSCSFLASRSLAGMGLGEKTPQQRAQSGFWLCHLTRLAHVPPARAPRYDAVFKAIEAQCPRLFPAGGDGASQVLANGEVRSYLQAEMKVYVYDSGEVAYKYYRALNAVVVGRVGDVLAGRSRVDCGAIRGRAGLPWDREI